MERRLSAILAADIVGYSAQMERDEEGTFARVTNRRKAIFEPEIARHQGRIFKTMGDGILAEFGSVVQAVECAVSIQTALEERNAAVPGDQAIRARIGINLGEVIVEGDDRYGEGVNIAARLEGLADPGGICVSEKVAREVEKKLAFGFQPMGPQKVKNIAEPVVAFRVSREPGPRRPTEAKVSRRWLVAGALLAVLLAATAFVWTFPRSTETALRREGPLSLAVLRFANLTGDAERDFVSYGIPEGLAIVFGSSPLLRYVEFYADRTTPQPDEMQSLADDLKVDLLLDGSFGVASPGVSFTGRLIDGATGAVVTTISEQVADGDLSQLQYLIAQKTLDGVAGITGNDSNRTLDPGWSEVSAVADEYNYLLRSQAALYSSALSGQDEALRLIEAGLERYPQSVLLRIAMADVHNERTMQLPEAERAGAAQAAWSILSGLPDPATLPLPERWYLLVVRAQVTSRATGNFEAAMRDAEAALALAPYVPGTNLRMSDVAANAGYGARAVEWAKLGTMPGRTPSDWQREVLGWALIIAGRPEEALAEYAQVWRHCLPCEVVALVRTGRMDKARKLAADIRRNKPDLTIASERFFPTGKQPFMAEPHLTAYLDDLRRAGLPEGEAPPP